MIKSFKGKVSQDIWYTNKSKSLPKEYWLRAKVLLTIMHSTNNLNDLRVKGEPPTMRLHKLKGDRKYFWSITIKLPWCIVFKFENGEFSEVKIENYHS